MGGLKNKIPWTHALFLIGTLAIAGIFPLSGFWSKDEILAHAFIHHQYVLYGMGAVGAFLTAFYMFRLTYLTFYGHSRMDHHTAAHVHESPTIMIGPLVALSVLAVVGGFPGVPPEAGWFHSFLHPVTAGGASGEEARRHQRHSHVDGRGHCDSLVGMGLGPLPVCGAGRGGA